MNVQLKSAAPSRNPMAGMLAHGAARQQIVRARKGKGSFRRSDKHKGMRGY